MEQNRSCYSRGGGGGGTYDLGTLLVSACESISGHNTVHSTLVRKALSSFTSVGLVERVTVVNKTHFDNRQFILLLRNILHHKIQVDGTRATAQIYLSSII